MRLNPANAIIEVKNLGTCFAGEWIHKGLNLTIMPNRIVTIIGASGCGKTTLIREILMLQPLSAGEIYLMGEKISSYSLEDPDTRRILSQMGMMFQQGALFSSYTVLENVMFPLLEYTNYSYALARELAYLRLKLSGLQEAAYNKYPKEISPGMLKRVALARTLALDPKVVFLDEPTAGLDPNSAASFDDLIIALHEQLNLTVIMITHDLDSIWHTSDEIVYLGNKKVLMHDTVINAANNPAIADLYEYFNGTRGKITKAYYAQSSCLTPGR
jgi:phospholipid/cholesterol/gamma-HCH transport system ATP-binding protein